MRRPSVASARARNNPWRRSQLPLRFHLEVLEDRTVPTAVAVLGAEFDAPWIEDVRSKVESTGLFTSVDAVDVLFSTPTLAQLETYDAVLVWSDFGFADPDALGNTLADFVDDGHGVVLATFTNTFYVPLGGRWASDGYDAIQPDDIAASSPLTLGAVAQPDHPIMAGVTNFDGGFGGYHSIGVLTPGTSLIASWSDGLPLVAEKSNLNIGLNFFPVSSDVFFDGWDSSTQGTLLMANALNYVSGFGVSSTVPANGSTVFAKPTEYVVNVNAPVEPGSLDAVDFQVNGQPATGVAYTPGSTSITFTFASDPVTAQGLQTTHVAAGAFVSADDGSPTREFNGTFRYDVVLMQVTSTNPAAGSTIILPATTLDLNFNEPYALSSAQTSDFIINQGSVVSVSQVDADTLRLTLAGVTAEGTLTVNLPAGAMTDVFGNAGAAFSASYTLDFGTFPFPTPLSSVAPIGSLVYTGSQVGIIDPAGDSDSFSVLVDPGQKITVMVDPAGTLRPVIELYRGSTLVGSATAGSAGLEAVLQAVATQGQLGTGVGPTTYTVTVRGAGGTTGGYTARMILNAVVESESHDGATNNTPTAAQNLDPSFLTFNAAVNSSQSSAFPGRAAVLGTLEGATLNVIDSDGFESGSLDGQWSTFSSQPQGRIQVSGAFGTASGSYALLMDRNPAGVTNLNEAIWTVDLSGVTAPLLRFAHRDFADEETALPLNFVGHAAGDGVAISDDGVRWRRVLNATNVPIGWQTVTIDLAAEAAAAGMTLGAGFQIKFQQWDNSPLTGGDGRGYDDIVVGVPVRAQDFHSFSLKAGESVTLAMKGTAGLELQNAAGTTLATAAGGPANVDTIISDFVAPATGTYYARISSASFTPSDYALVVTRNADFDTEGNNSLAAAQAVAGTQVAGRQWVLGNVGAQATTLQAIDSGWYQSGGFHDPVNGNYITGQLEGNEYRSFFVFDLSSLSGTLLSAQLGLFNPGFPNSGYGSVDPSETYTLFDVSTPIASLTAGGAGLTATFDDLGTGAQLGSQTVAFTGVDQLIPIDLNAAGLAYLNAAVGGQVAFGGAITTIGGPDDQYVFGFTNGGLTRQLTVRTLDTDFYQVILSDKTPLEVETATPASSAGVFDNPLDPMIRVYDSNGHLVASDDNSAGGRNARVKYNVPKGAGGTYYIEVVPSDRTPALTSGEYILSIKGNTAGQAQYVEGAPAAGSDDAAGLTNADLRQAYARALDYWAGQGADTTVLGSVDLRIDNMVDGMLGHAFEDQNAIVIDDDAAGHGWSFGPGGAPGAVELDEVVAHEVGHLLGFEHDDPHDVMQATLCPTVRPPVTTAVVTPTPAVGAGLGDRGAFGPEVGLASVPESPAAAFGLPGATDGYLSPAAFPLTQDAGGWFGFLPPVEGDRSPRSVGSTSSEGARTNAPTAVTSPSELPVVTGGTSTAYVDPDFDEFSS